jgi:hypothetical protein
MMTTSTPVSDDDAPPREPITDTWRGKYDGAAWIARFDHPGGDAAAVNAWCVALIDGVLADFTPLARVHAAMLLVDSGPVRLASRAGEAHATFRARVRDAIHALALPLIAVELALDLRVWFRAVDSPDQPALAWLRHPHMELVLSLDADTASASLAFEVTCTIFSAFSYPDLDPNPLHALNQPLLEAALRRFRARSRDEFTIAGELPGRHEFGFSSDRDDY